MDKYFPFLIAAAMIVFMLISSRRRKAQAAEQQAKVVVGAKVMLSSGIYGEILEINDDRVSLKSAGSTLLEVARGAVVRVVENAPEVKPATAKKPAAKKPAVKKPAAAKTPAKK